MQSWNICEHIFTKNQDFREILGKSLNFSFLVCRNFNVTKKYLEIFFCKFEHPTKLSFIHSLLHLVQQKFLPQIGLFFLSVAIVNSLIFQGTFNLQMEKVPSKFSPFFVLFTLIFFKQTDYSDIWYSCNKINTTWIQIGKKCWDLETRRKS